jgi:hypothetical protein
MKTIWTTLNSLFKGMPVAREALFNRDSSLRRKMKKGNWSRSTWSQEKRRRLTYL